MPIYQNSNPEEVEQAFKGYIERARGQIINRLAYIGEMCRNTALESHKYKVRTGNLESSTGYVIVDNGNIVQWGGFHGNVKQNQEGEAEGRTFAEGLAAKHSVGLVLVMVAGMQYACYVADMGLDVLDSAELVADKLLKELFENER